jgi:predicted amidophosphoribosyltransferase
MTRSAACQCASVPHARDLVSDVLDLVLGRRCLGCDEPGRPLCASCLASQRGAVRIVTTGRPLPPVAAAVAYDGLARRTILEYKEHGCRALSTALGVLLSDAVAAQARSLDAAAVTLVPVPSHRHAPRGFDALGGVSAVAQRTLRRQGLAVDVNRPLRAATAYRPLKGLGRTARQDHVAGAFRPVARGTAMVGRGPVIVVDDVITSGATVAESVGTLLRLGVRVDAVAVIAAVSRDRSATNPVRARPMRPR